MTLNPNITKDDLKNVGIVLSGAAPVGLSDFENLKKKLSFKECCIMQGMYYQARKQIILLEII